MIGAALRMDIEAWAARKSEKPFVMMAEEGRLTKTMVRSYIANATWMIHRTPGHIARVRDRARALGDHALADHYDHKLKEEVGHAAWGDADLDSFSRMAVPPTDGTLPSIVALASFLDELTSGDPALYLTYLAFTEYATVIVCPSLLTDIEKHCDVPRSAMTVIDKHIELDRDHAEEGFGIIDDLVPNPRKLGPLRETLARICAYFDRFSVEIPLVDEHASPQPHVSAA